MRYLFLILLISGCCSSNLNSTHFKFSLGDKVKITWREGSFLKHCDTEAIIKDVYLVQPDGTIIYELTPVKCPNGAIGTDVYVTENRLELIK